MMSPRGGCLDAEYCTDNYCTDTEVVGQLLLVHSCHQLNVAGQPVDALRPCASPAPLDGLAVNGIARDVVGALHLSTIIRRSAQNQEGQLIALHCSLATSMPPAQTRINQPSHSPSPLHTAPPHLGGEVQVAVAAGGARVNNHDDHRLAGGSAASSADGRTPPAQAVFVLVFVQRGKVRLIVGRQPAKLAGVEAACQRTVLFAGPCADRLMRERRERGTSGGVRRRRRQGGQAWGAPN